VATELEVLAARTCAACHARTPPAQDPQLVQWLAILGPLWRTVEGALERTWPCADFRSALELAQRAAAVSEAMGHHPQLTVAWGELRARLWTHATGSLTEADVVLAARLELACAGPRRER
jgi:4a-hydroxytetrahydrobiopterin dehydratase